MFKKILVPVDLTEAHGRSLEIAAELAGRGPGQVILLHVIELITGLSPEEGKDFYGRLEKKAREHLGKLGERLEEAKVTWCAEVRYGHRTTEILRHAQDEGCDLIVLTSHRIDPSQPAGWGGLSYKVGLLSPCPVLLVK